MLLQCLPLLFAGGCIASTFGPAAWYLRSPGDWIITVLGLFVFAWGFGYAYLRQGRRFGYALLGALVFAALARWLNIVLLAGCIDLGTSLDCPQRVRIFDRPFSLLTAAVVGFWVLLYARDALQLATGLTRGRSPDEAGSRSFLGRIAIVSAVIGVAVSAFYFSPYCSQIWQNTR